MPHDPSRPRRRHARFVLLSALGLTSAMLIVPVVVGHPRPPVFCSVPLPIAVVDGQTVVLQDQGKPGRHEEKKKQCGGGDYGPNGIAGLNTLGFDCNLRDEKGLVVGSSTPNRADGTCGQAD